MRNWSPEKSCEFFKPAQKVCGRARNWIKPTRPVLTPSCLDIHFICASTSGAFCLAATDESNTWTKMKWAEQCNQNKLLLLWQHQLDLEREDGKRRIIAMALCFVQEVCLILPDTQCTYDKKHPTALAACTCQSWFMPRWHGRVHTPTVKSHVSILSRFSSLSRLLLLFLHHFLLQSGCFSFSRCLKKKSC